MLTTKANVKTYLGISGTAEDTLIDMLVKFASGEIVKLIGWAVNQSEVKNKTFDGGSKIIRLGGKPIKDDRTADTPTFKVEYNAGNLETPNWVAMPASNYVVYWDEGAIEFVAPYDGLNNIRVSATLGYETIPDDLEFVAVKVTSRLYNHRKSEGIGSEAMEGANVSWQDELSEEEKAIIQAYKLQTYV